MKADGSSPTNLTKTLRSTSIPPGRPIRRSSHSTKGRGPTAPALSMPAKFPRRQPLERLVTLVYVPSGTASLFTGSSCTLILHKRMSVGDRLSGRGFRRSRRRNYGS
jgi:hypothetical protein